MALDKPNLKGILPSEYLWSCVPCSSLVPSAGGALPLERIVLVKLIANSARTKWKATAKAQNVSSSWVGGELTCLHSTWQMQGRTGYSALGALTATTGKLNLEQGPCVPQLGTMQPWPGSLIPHRSQEVLSQLHEGLPDAPWAPLQTLV
jgi:hypothetical protein